MNITGIICEYNPFHNGHRYQIEQVAQQTDGPVICAMSGNYVQRGEPAIFDKWSRTAMALAGGASLVIEIPTPYSLKSSEGYARAGVSLLHHTGLVNRLGFGSETSELSLLLRISETLTQEPEAYKCLLKERLDSGLGYAAARAAALSDFLSIDPEILRAPNALLAIDYLRALKDTAITPLLIPRKGGYHEATLSAAPGEFASATAIRSALREGIPITEAVPESVISLIPSETADPLDAWSDAFNYAMRFQTPESLRNYEDISEGLEHRLLKFSESPTIISEFIDQVSSKRYPKARIRRIVMRILLDLPEVFPEEPPYIRVLGCRKDALHLLGALKKRATLPVILNPPKDRELLSPEGLYCFVAEQRFSDLYALHNQAYRRGLELTNPIVIQ